MRRTPLKRNPMSSNRRHWLVLILSALMILTGCQKTTPFTYDPGAEVLDEAQRIISGPGIVFDPKIEKIVVITAAFHSGGEGLLQEYQMADFGVATVNTAIGEPVVISVPHDPMDGSQWQLSLNEHRTSSRAYLPEVFQAAAGQDYHRLNFLVEPTFSSDVHFTRYSAEGDRLWTFRVTLQTPAPASSTSP